jgi:hypothetical protein
VQALRHLTRAGVSLWVDPDSPVSDVGEGLAGWLAQSAVTGVGPSLCAARPGHLPRVAERIAAQLRAVHAANGGLEGLVQFPSPPDLWHSHRELVELATRIAWRRSTARDHPAEERPAYSSS